jgi:hypothetical protein
MPGKQRHPGKSQNHENITAGGVSAPISENWLGRINHMAGPNRPGRPHLGPREVVTTRLPVAVREAVDAAAAERGLDRSTYLADVIAARVCPG